MHAVLKRNLKNLLSNIYPWYYNGVKFGVNDLKGRKVVAIFIGLYGA